MTISAIKRDFDAVLRRVHEGEEIIVTRRGIPLGRLLPPL
ncbi:type II toxin-antitoxin system Phd/YefM family antitoxin [Sphingomonas psychrolutea]